MSHKRNRRSSSSDEEDNVPLKLIQTSTRTKSRVENSSDSLHMPKIHPCELCEHVSKNRYASLIHNVRHIIIPLINQTVHKCEICLYHFTSLNDLSQHNSEKHSLNVVTRSNNLEDEVYESDLVTIVKQENISQFNADCLKDGNTKTSHSKSFSIKNRLLFEEDIITSNSDKLLVDLTTECQVKVEWIPPIWETSYPNSVHYDELINPGVFRCKKCYKTFPSRYAAITHEAGHIFFKNSQVTQCELCKQYILGDINKLKQHHITSHAQEPSKKYFGGRSEENGGRCKENGGIDEPYIKVSAELKFCDICYSFCKNNSTHKYNCVSELSEPGKRYRCQKCGYKFFSVKLVNREIKYKYSSFHNKRNKKSHTTNHERLKNIAQRLKKMRTYFFLFYFDLLADLKLLRSMLYNCSYTR